MIRFYKKSLFFFLASFSAGVTFAQDKILLHEMCIRDSPYYYTTH